MKRKDETRRKILFGAAFPIATRSLPVEKQEGMLALVHGVIRNPKDRTFRRLEPIVVEASIRIADQSPFGETETTGIPFDFDD